MKPKAKLTPAQKKAREAYEYAERQEDRFAGSVFAGNTLRMRELEARTTAAFQACKALGMGVEHGL